MGLSRGEATLCFAVAALLAAASGLINHPAVWHGALLNPDSYMRMVRLDDMLSAARPLHSVLRDGSGDGAVLHWSHFLDAVLLALALPFRPFVSWHDALHIAAGLIGPVSVGVAGIAAAWAAAPLSLPAMRWSAAAFAGLAPAVVIYGFPGVVHHHVALGVVGLVLAGCAARVATGDAKSGWGLGLAATAGIWLSPETMPFIVIAFGAVGVAWLVAPNPAPVAAGAWRGGLGFLLGTLVGVVIDPPPGGYLELPLDGISLTFVLLAAVMAAIGWCLTRMEAHRLRAMVVAIAGLLAWVALFPTVLRGPDAVGTDADVLMAGVEEMLPVDGAGQGITLLGGGLLALGFCAAMAWRHRSWAWAYGAAVVVFLLAVGLLHIRFAIYATLAGAAVLPVLLSWITTRLADRPMPQMLGRVGLLAVALLSTRADAIGQPHLASTLPPPGAAPLGCGMDGLPALLTPYAGAVVLSEINDVPALLYRAPVRTVASLYHRNVPAFLRLRAAWRAIPGATPGPEFRATRATLVLVCPRGSRSVLVEDLPDGTLLDRMMAGHPPEWLQPIAADPTSGYVLYRLTEP